MKFRLPSFAFFLVRGVLEERRRRIIIPGQLRRRRRTSEAKKSYHCVRVVKSQARSKFISVTIDRKIRRAKRSVPCAPASEILGKVDSLKKL